MKDSEKFRDIIIGLGLVILYLVVSIVFLNAFIS